MIIFGEACGREKDLKIIKNKIRPLHPIFIFKKSDTFLIKKSNPIGAKKLELKQTVERGTKYPIKKSLYKK